MFSSPVRRALGPSLGIGMAAYAGAMAAFHRRASWLEPLRSAALAFGVTTRPVAIRPIGPDGAPSGPIGARRTTPGHGAGDPGFSCRWSR
jgi:hypothetical protein